MEFVKIIARFSAPCRVCGEEVGEGEECHWCKGWGVKHTYCKVKDEEQEQ